MGNEQVYDLSINLYIARKQYMYSVEVAKQFV